MLTSAPIIETVRLRLRAHRTADLPRYAALWAEEAVTRYTIGKPATEEESWLRLLRATGHWQLLGFGAWMVEDKSTRTLIGEVGLFNLHRDIFPSITGLTEAGWVFSSAAHGQGYAAEAMHAVLAWGASHPTINPRTVCLIDPGNTPSLRLAAKLGFKEIARTTYRKQPTMLLERFGAT